VVVVVVLVVVVGLLWLWVRLRRRYYRMRQRIGDAQVYVTAPDSARFQRVPWGLRGSARRRGRRY
jgi:hypothetical protein